MNRPYRGVSSTPSYRRPEEDPQAEFRDLTNGPYFNQDAYPNIGGDGKIQIQPTPIRTFSLPATRRSETPMSENMSVPPTTAPRSDALSSKAPSPKYSAGTPIYMKITTLAQLEENVGAVFTSLAEGSMGLFILLITSLKTCKYCETAINSIRSFPVSVFVMDVEGNAECKSIVKQHSIDRVPFWLLYQVEIKDGVPMIKPPALFQNENISDLFAHVHKSL